MSRSAWRTLRVTVTDVNDNAPRFERPVVAAWVAETAGVGHQVAVVRASDADEGDNARITFRLATDTPHFQLDPTQGVLSVAAPLDRERRDFYELTVSHSLPLVFPRLFPGYQHFSLGCTRFYLVLPSFT